VSVVATVVDAIDAGEPPALPVVPDLLRASNNSRALA